jgi:hypothetical protein
VSKEGQGRFGLSRFAEWTAKLHVVKKQAEQKRDAHNDLTEARSGQGRNPERPSQLDATREKLEKNRKVYVAGEFVEERSEDYRKVASPQLAETVDIIVSPSKPTYSPKELNAFMNGLIPDEESWIKDDFWISTGKLELGRVMCREWTERTGDERVINVRVYPDRESARTAYEYEKGLKGGTLKPDLTGNLQFLRHWIYTDYIEELKKGKNPFKEDFMPRKLGKPPELPT